MKKQARTLLAVLSLLLAAGSASAQTIHVKANIPFNSIVGQKALMAVCTRSIPYHSAATAGSC